MILSVKRATQHGHIALHCPTSMAFLKCQNFIEGQKVVASIWRQKKGRENGAQAQERISVSSMQDPQVPDCKYEEYRKLYRTNRN